jgi:hypothetical protein
LVFELNANACGKLVAQLVGSSDNRRTTINLGVGHRLLVEDVMAIVGINVFTDFEAKSRHRRLSLGLEYERGLVVLLGGGLCVVPIVGVRLTKI